MSCSFLIILYMTHSSLKMQFYTCNSVYKCKTTFLFGPMSLKNLGVVFRHGMGKQLQFRKIQYEIEGVHEEFQTSLCIVNKNLRLNISSSSIPLPVRAIFNFLSQC